MYRPIVRSFRLKRIYHRVFGNPMLRGARRLIATSEQERAELASAGLRPGEIVLRRNGVETPSSFPDRGEFRKAYGINPDAKLVLYLGRLAEKKSPDLLLRSFARLPGAFSGSSTQMAFVGPDENGMRKRLEVMASELGVAPRVHFVGALFGRKKWAAYRDADVFVLPSQNENFGNTAAEAAAAGTPGVVTAECGVASLLDGAALIVAHDEDAILRAMERVLSNPALHAKLAAGCRQAVARLGWDQPATAMEVLYGQLVKPETHVA